MWVRDITRRLSLVILTDLLRSGTLWRTFWGYINGYSERFKESIPAKKEVYRNVKQIGKDYQRFESWTSISAFVLLIVSQAGIQMVCDRL